MVEVSEVDVSNGAALREFHDVECAGLQADRPYVVLRSPEALARAATPSSTYRRELLVARGGGRVVGVAELGLFLTENQHLANLDVVVVPDARRHGVGRALHEEAIRRGRADGRTTYLSAVFQPDATTPSASSTFARALGYELLEEDHHLVLDLPLPEGHLDDALRVADGYELVTWGDRTPDDVVDAYAGLQTQMFRDLPDVEVDREPFVTTVAEIRETEERTASVSSRFVAAARAVDDGSLVGYSVAQLDHGSQDVAQLDTMVLTAHRGHGLGLAMKATILRDLALDHPHARTVHTWNAADNTPIQKLNRGLGFHRVEVAWQVQRRDADA